MKKILLVIVVLVVIVSAALAAFVLTFDINRYKANIETQLSSVVGNPVTIGALSLAWKGWIVAGIEDFNIYTEEAGTRASVLSFEKAGAVVDMIPLLQRQLSISSISVERLNLEAVRTKEGKIEVRGYSPKPAEPGQTGGKSALAAGPAIGFSIKSISVKDSTIRFQDMMTDPASDITIRRLDADVKNVSLTTPIQFSAKMAVASAEQNLVLSGAVGALATGNITLRDFSANTDLATFRYDEILKALPAISKIGLRQAPTGVVDIKVRELAIEANKIVRLSASADYTDGSVDLAQFKVPIEKINLSASAEDNALTVKSFSADLANGALKGSGTVDDYMAKPRTASKLTADVKGLRSFMSNVLGVRQNLDGDLNFTFDGVMAGTQWPEISQTLDGSGNIRLEKGMIVDTNIAAQTLNALTIFPGLLETVMQYVPERARQSLGRDYTVLKPIDLSYTVKGRYADIKDLRLQSDFIEFIGAGRTSLTGDVSAKGNVIFSQDISAALLKAVPNMKYLARQDGLIEFPLAIKAGGGSFKVIPDLKYVGQKVAVQKAQEVATDFLKKAMGQKEGAQAAQPAASGQDSTTKQVEDLLKSWIKE